LGALSGANLGILMYDGLGRRAAKSIDGATTQLLHDGLNLVQELNASGVPTANLLTGLRVDEFFARTDATGSRSFLTDVLGSALALTDATGAMVTTYSYEPFGKVATGGQPNANALRFAGREDDGTSLSYYRNRYYHPTLHRFVASDPAGFSGGDANLYAYVFNDPLNLTDPLGLLCLLKIPSEAKGERGR
jgi:RHS repeat-associated protein